VIEYILIKRSYKSLFLLFYMDLSIVIPCYNESKVVGGSIRKIDNYLKSNKKIGKYEIICIDDGSTDKTRAIISELIKSNKKVIVNKKRKNKGKGYSVREGVYLSKYSYILFTDADLSTPISELDKFISKNKEYDLLIASRNLNASRVKRSFIRLFISKTFTLLNKLITSLNYSDTQCGFKLFKRDVALDLFKDQKINGFAFDVEILMKAKIKKYNVLEIPVIWNHNNHSKVLILKDSFKMLFDIVRLRIIKNDL